ncbi:hypothetical protein V6C03_02280 [Methyloligella sp. 2.7D]|uniref:hypothetical protein n=1 Tax=unclassified Methyloligella TaxID=2625955 RepID=UPI00157BF6A7|nr:hypothetical protein [Methyloligella sp. GL2]QKP76543.1 hypothetical protein HT051_03140 [Methyloligella sp. GL2]
MLAEELMHAAGGRSVWLRMEPRFAEPGTFLSALVSAIGNAMPGKSLPPLGSEDIAFAQAYLRRLLKAAITGESSLMLVIDDLHVVGEDSQPSNLLANAIRDLNPDLQVVLASRAPPDPCWSWHAANGRNDVVTFDDLRLEADEAALLIDAIAAKRGDASWSAEELAEISGGWILGARLLLQGGRHNTGANAVAPAAETSAPLLELLANEVLAPLSEEDLDFLLRAVRLPNMPVGMLAESVGAPFSKASVARLARKTLFVEMDGGGRLQIHDLLKAAVAHHRPEGLPEAEVLAISKRAGEALLAEGDLHAGLTLLSSVGAWEALRDAVLEAAPQLAEAGEFGVLYTALEAMPEEERGKTIGLQYWFGVSLLNLNPPRARALLSEAYQKAKAEAAEDYIIPLWAALVDAIWFEWVDCSLFDPLIEELPELEKLAKKLNRPEYDAQLARGAFAALSFRAPEHPNFPEWEERDLACFWQNMPRHETIRRGIQLMFRYCWGDGERWKASQVRTRLNYIFDEEAAAPADICTRYVVSTEFMSIFEPDATEVIATVDKGLAATDRYQLYFWDVPMLNAALYKVMSLEDRQRARDYLALLASRLGPHSRPHDVAIHEHFSAYDHWLEDRFEAAMTHALTAYRASIESGFSISPVYYGLGLAAISQSMGQRREALTRMRKARRIAQAQRSAILIFISCLRGAALAASSGRPERAKPYLERALSAGAAKRIYVHPWLRRQEMAELLNMAVDANIEAGYAHELLRVLHLAAEQPKASPTEKPLQIVSLGGIDIFRHGSSLLQSGKMQKGPIALAAQLVAAGPSGDRAEAFIDRIWGDVDETAGRNRLKSTVYRLRQLFGEADAVVTAGGRVMLNADLVSVDAWELEALSRSPTWSPAARYQRMLTLYAGPFAPSQGSDVGTLVYRQHIEGIVSDLFADFAEGLTGASDWSRALSVAKEGLSRVGFTERLYAVAMRTATELGNEREIRGLTALLETDHD